MDLETQKKSGKGLVVAVIILVFSTLLLGGYIIYDKLLDKESVVTDSTNKNSSIKKEQEKNEKSEKSLDIRNENVRALFESSYDHISLGVDDKIFQTNRLSVEDMDENYKIRLAYSIFGDKIEQDSSNNSMKYSINEEDVKAGYERIFGPNTFQRPNSINLGCGDYIYNSQTKKFVNETSGCGGTTLFSVEQDIIRATQYQDRMEIIVAVAFIDGNTNAMYKDYQKQEKIRDLTDQDLINTVDNPSSKRFKQYIQENKDNLAQYTYTYQLGNDGFYYYTGVKKTK